MDNKPSTLTRTESVGPNGHDDPAKLRAEIAETRNEMSGTLEELHGRLNPVVLKEQALDQFHEATETIKNELNERLQDAKATLREEIVHARAAVREATIGKVENMMRGVRDVVADNPIPAALAGVGLAWLFLQGRRGRASELPEGATPIRDVGQKAGRKIADVTKEAASAVSHVAQEAKESVSDVAQRTGSKASELSHEAGQQVRRAQRRGGELYRANPIAVGTALLAAGTFVGLAIPRTRVEDEWLGETREKVVDRAQDLAHQALGKAGEAVKQTGAAGESQGETSGFKLGDEYH